MPAPGLMAMQAQSRRPSVAVEGMVRTHLDRLLNSSKFDASARSRAFLRFVVDEALAGHGNRLNQTSIAIAVFDRGSDFDAVLDPIVRVQAGRLRRSLERYYLLAGTEDGIRIELPKGRYAPSFVASAQLESITPPIAIRTQTVAHGPTIVIHPFLIASDAEEEVAERITDELTAELHRHGEITVARQRDIERLALNSFPSRFELHGRVRHHGEDYLFSVRLVDRTTAEELWGDEFRAHPCLGAFRTIEDIAQIVAARIGSEHGVILRTLAREHGIRPHDSGTTRALACCHRFYFSHDITELSPAIDAAKNVVARDPECAAAWSHIARLHLLDYALELDDSSASIEKAITSAHRAVLLEPISPRYRCTLAEALLIKGELEAALCEVEHVVILSGHSLAHRETIGWLAALAGRWERGIDLLQDAVARNPYALPRVPHVVWADRLQRGDFDSAYIAALECRGSGFFWPELMLASALGLSGRATEARMTAADLLRVKPTFLRRGRALIGHYIKSPELIERIVEGLERCGLVVSP